LSARDDDAFSSSAITFFNAGNAATAAVPEDRSPGPRRVGEERHSKLRSANARRPSRSALVLGRGAPYCAKMLATPPLPRTAKKKPVPPGAKAKDLIPTEQFWVPRVFHPMSRYTSDEANFFRSRAREIMSVAQEVQNEGCRAILLQMAHAYEKHANRLVSPPELEPLPAGLGP
jgi:hypothetical protein